MSKPCVFISSTSEDLQAYRSAAHDAALRAGFFPAMMEYWTAQARPALSVCLSGVDEAELLVVIVAHRFGWTPPDQPAGDVRKSITWLECERAAGRSKDVLAFLLDDKHPWPAEWREDFRYTESGRKGELTAERVQTQHPNRPVVGVSWYEAAAFAAWAKCRLPIEAEWERAARGGNGRKYPWGDQEADPTRMNYSIQRETEWKPIVGHPTPVGIYPLGLSPEVIADLAGYVWEWCADWFEKHSASDTRDPTGPSSGVRRVVRGGSWSFVPRLCRVSYRDLHVPTFRYQYTGFRVVWGLFGQDSSREP